MYLLYPTFNHYFTVYFFYLLQKKQFAIKQCARLCGQQAYTAGLHPFCLCSIQHCVILYSSMLFRLTAQKHQTMSYSRGVQQAILSRFVQVHSTMFAKHEHMPIIKLRTAVPAKRQNDGAVRAGPSSHPCSDTHQLCNPEKIILSLFSNLHKQ